MKRDSKFHMSIKFLISLLTIICFSMIALTFLKKSAAKPLQNAAASVIIPMQKGINGLGLWLTDKSDYLETVDSLRKENETLKTQLEFVNEKNLILVQDQMELNNLRTLYQLDQKIPGYTKVAARVIGKSSGNWFSTFTLNKGSKDGIKVNMNVICGNGLVGIVTDVADNYSTVRSIIDDKSNVTGMMLTTSDTCNVRGDLSLMDNGMIHLEYLSSDAIISDGEMIVTSNISDKYLEGILIGYAKNITEDSNSLTQSGYLIPAVDFEHMTEVLVILDLKE